MKRSTPFLHKFDHHEIQKENFVTGKYQVAFDHEDDRVFGIYINLGLDMPQDWEQIDLDLPHYGSDVYEACEKHLIEIMI